MIQEQEKPFAVYCIDVCTKFNKYRITKRYTEFLQLFTHLKSYRGYSFKGFPPKTWFPSLNDRFLEGRRNQLNDFLGHAVEFARENQVRAVYDFLEFTKLAVIR